MAEVRPGSLREVVAFDGDTVYELLSPAAVEPGDPDGDADSPDTESPTGS
jgi:hypothetical protein